jgi:hypothetical protein
MSNVRKAFQTKSLLRRMADGGIFKSIVNGVPTFTDKDRAAPDAKAYVPTAMRELPNTGIVPGGTALPQAPAAPMPAPAKLSVARANACAGEALCGSGRANACAGEALCGSAGCVLEDDRQAASLWLRRPRPQQRRHGQA